MRGSVLATAATVFLVVLSLRASLSGADSIADSCGAIRDFVDVGFCNAALRSSPKAAGADRFGHLLIATDLAISSGASARSAAGALARDEPDGAVRNSLEACGVLYGTSVPALRFMRGYAAARSWAAARSLLSLTGQAGIGCEAALGTAAAARMVRQNGEFDQLTTMATALLNKVS